MLKADTEYTTTGDNGRPRPEHRHITIGGNLALAVVAEQDRLTPRTLELLQHAVTEAIDEIEQLSDLALGVTVLPEGVSA
jgi:hypothetical protein